MADTPSQDLRSSWNLSPIDFITRSTASALLLIYSAGFVILGFHDAKYGVVQFSPFRTRIMLVGLVFSGLVAVTAWTQHTQIGYFDMLNRVRADADPTRSLQRDVVLSCGFIFAASIMGSILNIFFFASIPQQQAHLIWRVVGRVLANLLCIQVFVHIDKIFAKKPVTATWNSTAASVSYLLILGALFPASLLYPLTTFFATVGSQTIIFKKSGGVRYLANVFGWPWIFLGVWIYINQVFSIVPPRWGGGRPVPVQIFQSTPATWSPTNPIDALLLDETDQGMYILLPPSSKTAFFVPRSNIASTFFGSKEDLSKLVHKP